MKEEEIYKKWTDFIELNQELFKSNNELWNEKLLTKIETNRILIIKHQYVC